MVSDPRSIDKNEKFTSLILIISSIFWDRDIMLLKSLIKCSWQQHLREAKCETRSQWRAKDEFREAVSPHPIFVRVETVSSLSVEVLSASQRPGKVVWAYMRLFRRVGFDSSLFYLCLATLSFTVHHLNESIRYFMPWTFPMRSVLKKSIPLQSGSQRRIFHLMFFQRAYRNLFGISIFVFLNHHPSHEMNAVDQFIDASYYYCYMQYWLSLLLCILSDFEVYSGLWDLWKQPQHYPLMFSMGWYSTMFMSKLSVLVCKRTFCTWVYHWIVDGLTFIKVEMWRCKATTTIASINHQFARNVEFSRLTSKPHR